MLGRKIKKNTSGVVRSRRASQPTNESFRRNAVVFSRAQKELAAHQQSVTQRQIEKKRATQRRGNRLKFSVFAVTALLVASLFRMSVNSVHLESNASSKLSESEKVLYEAAIMESFTNNTVAHQWWLADTRAAAAAIQEEFPEIERVTLSSKVPISASITADVRFRKPVFTWQDASGQQQFVDSEGVLFSKDLDPTINSKKLIKIEDQSGVVIDAGNAVLTKPLIQFIGQLHTKLPPLYSNKKIVRVIIPRSTREVQVQVDTISYIIKFNSIRDINQQVGELSTLLGHLKAKNITPTEYIDMRVQHKAFYK